MRLAATTYTAGCLAVLQQDDLVLLLDEPHHRGLSLPGGLLNRHETPRDCVVRETREECGLVVQCHAQPTAVLVDHDARRIDMVFLCLGFDGNQVELAAEVKAIHWLPWTSVDVDSATGRALSAVLGPPPDL